jgi:hypothetical protein
LVVWLLAVAAGILTPRAEGVVPRDTVPFPLRPYSHMEALLEKTLFKVDVLTLDVQVDPNTALRLQTMVEGFEYSKEVADAVSRTVLAASQVWVRMEFLRSVSQKQYLDGIRDNMKKALKADLIDKAYYEDVQNKTPQWYDFLKERSVQKGDVMVYWVHGDTLASTFHGVEGTVLLDMTRENPTSRYGVLGSYFAPKSAFRKNLVRSLLGPE